MNSDGCDIGMAGGGAGNEVPSLLPKCAKRPPYCTEKSEFKHILLLKPPSPLLVAPPPILGFFLFLVIRQVPTTQGLGEI